MGITFDGNKSHCLEVDFEGERVSIALLGNTSWSYPDDGKNARYRALIAQLVPLLVTAPDLYEALEALVVKVEAYRDGHGFVGADLTLATEQARAALEKATPQAKPQP